MLKLVADDVREFVKAGSGLFMVMVATLRVHTHVREGAASFKAD